MSLVAAGYAYYGTVCDIGVREEETFEFRWGDLKATDFDEFLW